MPKLLSYVPPRTLRWAIAAFLTLVIMLYLLVAHDHSLANHVWLPFTSTSSSPSKSPFQTYNDKESDSPELCRRFENYYTCLGTRPRRVKGAPSTTSLTKGSAPYARPQHCVDQHLASGISCPGEAPSQLDVVWIWANGSDPLFKEVISDAQAASLGESTSTSKVTLNKGAKLYRYAFLFFTQHRADLFRVLQI